MSIVLLWTQWWNSSVNFRDAFSGQQLERLVLGARARTSSSSLNAARPDKVSSSVDSRGVFLCMSLLDLADHQASLQRSALQALPRTLPASITNVSSVEYSTRCEGQVGPSTFLKFARAIMYMLSYDRHA